ncbi:VanZ family protein [Desulfurobacterium indicum]|uniref:VanZ family protein n=1 Tax=Desulfurobacterium indicum TaxID=1914305 RepID=UPI00097710B4|nr:VanZ family protein [Desulfurobacterium indicum]
MVYTKLLTQPSFLGSFSFKSDRLFLILFIYGVFIEFTQLFIPGRYCDWKDVLADVIGIFCGLASFLLFSTVKHKDKET